MNSIAFTTAPVSLGAARIVGLPGHGNNLVCARKRSCGGFTLVELLVGVTMVAIITVVGVPMFNSFILDQRLRATTSDLRIALTTARSEAVKRNKSVRVQPIDADKGWASGWTVIAGADPDDQGILNFQLSSDVTIITTPDVAALQFTPMGRAATIVEFAVDVGPPASGVHSCMQLELDGRITSKPGACAGG